MTNIQTGDNIKLIPFTQVPESTLIQVSESNFLQFAPYTKNFVADILNSYESQKIVLPSNKEVEQRIQELKNNGFACRYCGRVTCASATGSTICEPDTYGKVSPMFAAMIGKEWGDEELQFIVKNNMIEKN